MGYYGMHAANMMGTPVMHPHGPQRAMHLIEMPTPMEEVPVCASCFEEPAFAGVMMPHHQPSMVEQVLGAGLLPHVGGVPNRLTYISPLAIAAMGALLFYAFAKD